MVVKKAIFNLITIGSIGISATFAQQTIFNVTDPSFNNNVVWTPDYNLNRRDDNKIKNAITAAIASRSGGIIYFPKGYYFVNGPIDIGDGVTTSVWEAGLGISIRGDGRTLSQIFGKSDNDVFRFRGGHKASDPVEDVPPRGDKIISYGNKISDLSILKTTEANCPGGGTALDLMGVSGALIDNVEITTDGSIDYTCGIKLSQDESRVHHIYLGHCETGVQLLGHCNSTSITESQIWSCNKGIAVYGGGSIRIQNNTFGLNKQTGIYAETNYAGGSLTNNIWSLLISGNEMEGNGFGGDDHSHIWLKNNTGFSKLTDIVKGVTISDNYFNLIGSSHDIPYDIANGDQRLEITFNRNVYWAGPRNDDSVVRTERFITNGEQYPPATIP